MIPVALFLSPVDMAIVFVVALLLFGPNKLPELGRQIGQAMKEVRKLTDEFTGVASSIRQEVEPVFKPASSEPASQITQTGAAWKADDEAVSQAGHPEELSAPSTVATGGLRISTLPPEPGVTADKGE